MTTDNKPVATEKPQDGALPTETTNPETPVGEEAGNADHADARDRAVLKDLEAEQTPSGGSCGSNPNLAMSHLVGDGSEGQPAGAL